MKNDNKQYGVEGVYDLFKDTKKLDVGVANITTFHFDEKENRLFNMRAVMDGGAMFFMIREGDYVRLHVDGELMMTDTGMERYSNSGFINKANGRVMVAGLGIGMVLHNILYKPEVTDVVVYEKYADVIKLVGPKFQHPKLTIIEADIFEVDPKSVEKFDTIYFDIWPTINTKNLPEINKLHNRWKNRLNRANPKAWMGSWMAWYLKRERAKERREERAWSWR